MNPVKMEHHIKHLQELHDTLDIQIKNAYTHFISDVQVQQLKKKKLRLKDEIEHCKKELNK